MKPREVCSCGALRSDDDPRLIMGVGQTFISVVVETEDDRTSVERQHRAHYLRACRVCSAVYYPGTLVP